MLAGAVLDSYLRLSQGLLAGLARLGLAVSKAPPTNRSGADAGPVCFEVPSAYEIVAGGKKLVGSAQSRRQGWVLQHGTLPLVGDVTRLVEVVALADEAERPALRNGLGERAVTVADLLGAEVTSIKRPRRWRVASRRRWGSAWNPRRSPPRSWQRLIGCAGRFTPRTGGTRSFDARKVQSSEIGPF